MTRWIVRLGRYALFLAASVLIAGCGGSVGPTSGVVRFEDGSPVQSGSVEFRSLDNQQRFTSRIASDGSFAPADSQSNVGLPPGRYEVVVVQIVMTEDLAADAHTHGQTVPRKYADYYTSGLTVDVGEKQSDPVQIRVEAEE